jgi:hypothetical protein
MDSCIICEKGEKMGMALSKFAKKEERKGATTGNVIATAAGGIGVATHANNARIYRNLHKHPELDSAIGNIAHMAGTDKAEYVSKIRRTNLGMGLAAGALGASGIYNMLKKKDKKKD